jgi:hypothetical protein
MSLLNEEKTLFTQTAEAGRKLRAVEAAQKELVVIALAIIDQFTNW